MTGGVVLSVRSAGSDADATQRILRLEQAGDTTLSRILLVATLLLPEAAMAQLPGQFGPQQQFLAPNVVVTLPFAGGTVGANPLPFETQQTQQQRLLEMLNTGGIERPAPAAVAAGCMFAGQIYSEGALVRAEGGDRQVCLPRPGAEPDAAGHLPLAWQAAPDR
ncbi:hypothetical protein [Roseomonas gilardii]|uniref:hypothetical protein n=1 Tax=Roseomonas gilardii TaxID=257708 RepID=UPI0016438A26|nr:hypothetical protein [Roseomonas gilardii]